MTRIASLDRLARSIIPVMATTLAHEDVIRFSTKKVVLECDGPRAGGRVFLVHMFLSHPQVLNHSFLEGLSPSGIAQRDIKRDDAQRAFLQTMIEHLRVAEEQTNQHMGNVMEISLVALESVRQRQLRAEQDCMNASKKGNPVPRQYDPFLHCRIAS